jgi:tetratricopeptide (TPR) repeat protein
VDARDSAQMDRLRSAAASMKDVSVDLDRPLKTPLPPITPQGEFERLLGQGRAHLAARRPDQALRAFEDATRAAPQYPDPDILRALALAMQGKGAQAVEAAGVAVSKDPTDPDLAGMARAIQARFGDISTASEYERRTASDSLTTAGYGLLSKGQTAQALENLESALKAWAQNPEALLGRGAARTVLGQNDAALKDLLQARKLFKREDNKNRLAVALAMSAAARLSVLDRDHASGELRLESAVRELDVVADEAAQAIDLDARLELGHYAHVQGRAFKAGLLQAAEQAVKWEGIQAAADDFVKKRPDSSMAYSARATVGFFRNEFKQAAEDLSKGIEINASSPALYRQRAVAYHKGGDFGKAVADYNRSLQIAPADWVYAEATRQLLRLAQDKKQIP